MRQCVVYYWYTGGAWPLQTSLPNYRRLPQTNIYSPQNNFYLQQTNSNVWESYMEDGKLPQTTFYLLQTN